MGDGASRVCVLFVVVEIAMRHGLEPLLAGLVGTGDGDAWRVGLVGAAGSNLVNNLPAYLALEPVADGSGERLMALLVGVNAGSIVTVWGSLATLLWRDRCRRAGLTVDAWPYAVRSLALCRRRGLRGPRSRSASADRHGVARPTSERHVGHPPLAPARQRPVGSPQGVARGDPGEGSSTMSRTTRRRAPASSREPWGPWHSRVPRSSRRRRRG